MVYSSNELTLIKLQDGTDGLPGAKGQDGKTLYTWIKYSVNEDGNPMTDDPTNAVYIGVAYNKEDKTESTNYKDYAWSRIRGLDGERGLQGLQGERGEQGIAGTNGIDGKTTYFHIKYSDNASGNPMTEIPSAYIGTYVDYISDDSTDYTKYTWSQFVGSQGEKGDQGIAGKNGENGQTSYLHIAYANSSDGSKDFDVSVSRGKEYIGQYTDFILEDSTNYLDYSWSLIKGTDGVDGYTIFLSDENHTFAGVNGKAIATSTTCDVIAYKGAKQIETSISSSITGLCTGMRFSMANNNTTSNNFTISVTEDMTATSGTLSIPIIVDGKKFIKQYTYTLSCSGIGINSVEVQYYLSTSSSTLSGGTWSKQSPTWVNGKYIWSKTVTYLDNGTTTESNPVCVTGAKGNNGANGLNGSDGKDGLNGSDGIDGADGADGVGVANIEAEFYLSTSKDSAFGGSWTTTAPTWEQGKYIWTRSRITYTDSNVRYTTPLCDSSWCAVNDLADKVEEQFTTITNTISGVESKVDSVQGSITNKVWQSDITTSINNYDSSSVQSIRDRVAITETSITGIKSTVSDVQSSLSTKADSETVSNMNVHISTVEQTADKINWLVKSGTSASNFELTDRSATLISDYINLNGLVTFSGLNSSAQNKINNAQDTADNAQNNLLAALNNANIAQDSANAAQGSADRAIDAASSATVSAVNAQNSADGAQATADAITNKVNANFDNWNNSYLWTSSNGTNMASLLSMVKKWTNNAVSDTTTINGGWISTNTITAKNMLLGDYTNYATVNEKNSATMIPSNSVFGGTKIENGYVVKSSSTKGDFPLNDFTANFFVTGEQLYFEFYGKASSNTRAVVKILFLQELTRDANGVTVSCSGINSCESSIFTITTSEQKITGSIPLTVPYNAKYMCLSLFNGLDSGSAPQVYIKNITVKKKYTGALIVDGTIVAENMATDAIKSKNYQSNVAGSFLNLADGSFDSKYLKWNSTGAITATSGTIGGWTINSTDIYNENGSYGAGIGSYGNSYAFWAGCSYAKRNDTVSPKFYVGHDGNLFAKNANITGIITATGGIIGGFSIGDISIYSSCSDSGHTYEGVLQKGVNGNTLFWNTARDGNLVTYCTYDGYLFSSNGSIGGWNISLDSIYQGDSGISSHVQKNAFWAGETNGHNGDGWSDATFKVGHDGSLVATKATISGTITATGGTIGGFSINSSHIYSSNTIGGVLYEGWVEKNTGYASNWFWGVQVGGQGISYLRYSGELYTKNLIAEGGSIGGWSISSDSIYQGDSGISSNINKNAFWAGETNGHTGDGWSNAAFRVLHNGDTYISKLIVNNDAIMYGTANLEHLRVTADSYFDTNMRICGKLFLGALDENWHALSGSGLDELLFVKNNGGTPYVQITTSYGVYGISAWVSDRKLKKNIIDTATNATSMIKQIKHRSFDWKEDNTHIDCGYIAQEMEEISPEFVLKINDEKNNTVNYQINENGIIPVVTKSIQELVLRIEQLEKEVKRLNG